MGARRNPSFLAEVGTVTVKPSESITIWLDKEAGTCKRNCSRVELRVLPNGARQIFVDEGIEIKSFEDWEPISEVKP